MATTYPSTRTTEPTLSALARGARRLFLLLAVALLLSIVLQVFFAGSAVLVDPTYWGMHTTFAHLIELVILLLIGVGFFAKLPGRVLGHALLCFLLISLQYVFLYALPGMGLGWLRGLHAANALAFFWVALYLIRATRALRE
jgi:hypothetical protein